MRKEGESSKCLNELLLSRMSRFRASHSATLAALTGSAITNTVKEEQSGNLVAKFYSHQKQKSQYIIPVVHGFKIFSGDIFVPIHL